MMNFPDIPRFYTGLAEALAVLLISFPLLRQRENWLPFLLKSGLILGGQIALQLLAGILPLIFWIPGMLINIFWMFFSFWWVTKNSLTVTFYLTAKAFISAELVAAVSWHGYCLLFYPSLSTLSPLWEILTILIFFSLLFTLLFSMNRQMQLDDLEKMISKREVTTAIFTAFVIFIISNLGFLFTGSLVFYDSNSTFLVRTMTMICGMLAIYIEEYQRKEEYLKTELLAMNAAFQLQYSQYQAYRENSELISRKVHDLKHQLHLIRKEADNELQERYFQELESSIHSLEAKIETGNPVLDTILSQKNAYCLEHGINFTCIVDGQLLNSMDAMDVSALFGNALDNAIEAVEKIPQKEQRLITLKLSQKGQFIILRLSNYDLSDLQAGTHEFPKTSKKNADYHGIGLKSMAYIVHKYKGSMTLSKEDNWVHVKILFPKSPLHK